MFETFHENFLQAATSWNNEKKTSDARRALLLCWKSVKFFISTKELASCNNNEYRRKFDLFIFFRQILPLKLWRQKIKKFDWKPKTNSFFALSNAEY